MTAEPGTAAVETTATEGRPMRIGIIGAGHIGATLARHFADTGHEVLLANSRGPQTLAALVTLIGDPVRAVRAEEAARFGELVVVAVPYGRTGRLPLRELRSRIVVDTCNYHPDRDGYDVDLERDTTTSSEKLRAATRARVVKAFNTLYWEDLRDHARPPGSPDRLAVPLAGDDEEAKAVVWDLVDEIGFDPVDAGRLGPGGRRLQPGSAVHTTGLSAPRINALLHTG